MAHSLSKLATSHCRGTSPPDAGPVGALTQTGSIRLTLISRRRLPWILRPSRLDFLAHLCTTPFHVSIRRTQNSVKKKVDVFSEIYIQEIRDPSNIILIIMTFFHIRAFLN